MKRTADFWIQELNLEKHPEGGWFREVYRSSENLSKTCLPDRYNDRRAMATSIYFLLEENDFSVFHRIKSDETWHFYDGSPLELHTIDKYGTHAILELGLEAQNQQSPQITIPFGTWFSARSKGDYTLVGCTVAPGFDFNDFEMGSYKALLKTFPQHAVLIRTYTRND